MVHYLRYTIKVKKKRIGSTYLLDWLVVWLVGWLVALLMSTSAIRLYCERVPRMMSDNFTCCHTETERVSAGHIILTPTQSVESGWPERGSNPRPPHQESRALPRPRFYLRKKICLYKGFRLC